MLERFGPYQLVRRLATGGMAEVFLALQTGIEGFEREVVIKRILPHRAQDEEFCTMFLDEARLIARLNHPFIAQIYDLGHVDGSYFIAMEHVHGADLSRLLDLAAEQRASGLPLEMTVPVLTALCEALEYIHTRTDELGNPLNIVHRDLNPKNVILSFEGAVKLIDFGIAKAASQVYETRTGVIKGTYGYMAPEQVSRRYAIDARADLFALGVLSYELTTGCHPFDAPDEVAVLSKLVQANFDPPSTMVRGYPRELEHLILNCMSLDPKRRPGSAREVLRQLEDFAVSRKIPLTMSRIADYVQSQVSSGEPANQIPALAVSPGDSTALISQRLASRADHETGTLATSLLSKSPPPSGPSRPSAGPSRPSRRQPRPASSKSGWQWPWESWGRRERLYALVATSVALLAALTTGMLIIFTWQPAQPAAPQSQLISPDPEPVPDDPSHPTEPPDRPLPPDDVPPRSSVDNGGGDTTLFRVESEPPGAQIIVAGERSSQVTPASVSVSEGQRLIWIRLELEGYEPQERQVEVAAGAAFFRLEPAP